ncbi:hypothetical protein GCM10010400_38060 [Streptomyces aculeolatus]|uniref:hypothetical protein n=1 Tax=Streptomyces aculeolatus TaxID=270689 RepID=UPI001CED24F6|nr:hypothetical protein [Streptomyces aculeolatus]
MATRLDLITRAQADAAPFLADHPLPDSDPPELDLTAYRSALAAAQSPAEVSAVTQHLLDAAAPVLQAVSDCLVEAAQWRGHHRDAVDGPPRKRLMAAASRALDVLAIADEADLARLRAEYDPAPALPSPAPGRPPGPPPTSPGAPRQGGGRSVATRSFIARPTDAGYVGANVLYDGYPSGRLPLLLASYRYRFGSDIAAMSRHLIDDVPASACGWEELGADLLHGAPEELRHALTGAVDLRRLTSLTRPPHDAVDGAESLARGDWIGWPGPAQRSAVFSTALFR